MDGTLWRAPLLLALLVLAAPAAEAMQGFRSGPCVGEGVPPRVQPTNCGPDPDVGITLRFDSTGGPREIQIGSCEDRCDLRVTIDVAACQSTSRFGRPQAVVEGDVRVADRHGNHVHLGYRQVVLVHLGFLPWCVEDDVS